MTFLAGIVLGLLAGVITAILALSALILAIVSQYDRGELE